MTQSNDLERRLQDIELRQFMMLSIVGTFASIASTDDAMENFLSVSEEFEKALRSDDLEYRADVIKRGNTAFKKTL